MVDVVVVSWLSLFVLVELLGRLLGGDPLGRGSPARHLESLSSLRTVVGIGLVVAVCEVLPVALRGATLGKAMLGLRVVRLDTFGPPHALDALLRALVLYGPLAVPVVGPLLSLAIAVPVLVWPTRRGLHDLVAGTVVIGLEAPWTDLGGDSEAP